MPPVEEVSFELERFEWTADDRLEVVGRWIGVRGRRMTRPALTVEAGGRRHRVSGSAQTDGSPESPWRASFTWDGSRGEIASVELELGRSLVVELPQPRRRRRRDVSTAVEGDLRAQVAELSQIVAELRAERAAAPSPEEVESLREEVETLRGETGDDAGVLAELRAEAESARTEAERLTAEVEALRAEAPQEPAESDDAEIADELAGLRVAHGSLKAAYEQLEDELEDLRGVRDERDELAGQLEQLRTQAGDSEGERAQLGEIMRELQNRASRAEAARDRLASELSVAREAVARLQGLLAEREEALGAAEADAERRVESERATTTEVHARLASAREEAQKTLVAEAEETERLRAELEQTRGESERQLAAERAEVARLREELLTSERLDDDEGSRRMLERVTRDLERERATSRNLRRELDAARSESAEIRRAGTNGAPAMDEPPAPVTAAGRAVLTPQGTQRRVEAARAAAEQRVPRVPPSPVALWLVRLLAAGVVAALGLAFVILLRMVT